MVLTLLACMSCGKKQVLTVDVNNTLPLDRMGELVEVSLPDVYERLQLADTAQLVVLDEEGEEIPYQITSDDKLLFAVHVTSLSSESYTIRPGQPVVTEGVKACGRSYPERYDDMAWENDLVGFRAYGPALQAKGERGFGYDLFLKRGTHEPVVEELYAMELDEDNWKRYRELEAKSPEAAKEFLNTFSYHIDHGYGMDCYAVGATLGAGVAALVESDTIVYPWCYQTQEVLDNGPLRFTVRLTFAPVQVGADSAVVESRLITLDAGTHLNRTVVSYEGLSRTLPIVAGFALHGEMPFYEADKEAGYITYQDPTTGSDNGELYLGAAFPSLLNGAGVRLFSEVERKWHSNAYGHLLAEATYEPGDHFVYYWGFGWNRADVKNVAEWNQYMKDFVLKLHNPLQVVLK